VPGGLATEARRNGRRVEPGAERSTDRCTSANLFTDWEVHGPRAGTNNTSKTPGQAFTDEWGVGQILPLKKDMSQLLQVGVIGYDQWQIADNGGTFALGNLILPASRLPYYSVHPLEAA
jgi:hypothetical protein